MGDHHADAAPAAYAEDRLGEGGFALRIEVGIRLVEDHEEGVAVQGAGEADALALSGGETRAVLADARVVALGQAQDQFVDTGRPRRRDGLGGIRPVLEPGDVLRDRAGEQLHLLREIAEMRTQGLARPLVEGRPVDADLPMRGRPDADQGAGEGGLPRGARADHAEPLSGREGEGRVLHRRLATAGRDDGKPFHRQAAAGGRQGMRPGRLGQAAEQVGQAAPAQAGGGEALPVGDGEFGGGEGTRDEDGRGDDDAARRLVVDHQPRPESQDAGLQGGAERLRQGAIAAHDIGRTLLRETVGPVDVRPAQAEAALHAQGRQHLGIAAGDLREAAALLRRHRRLDGGLAGRPVGEERHRHQHQHPDDGRHADERMEQEADGEVDRHPRQVE